MDKNFRAMVVKVALLVGVLAAVSLCIWYYSIPTESDILVLDKSVLTVILDDIPAIKKEAISVAQERIVNETGVPKRNFDRYFTLMDSSLTQFQWHLVYNVTGNQDLTVFLVKQMLPEEGFRIADEYIMGMVGKDYFDAHVKRKAFQANTAHYSYTYVYEGSHNPGTCNIGLSMWVRLGNDRNVIGQHVVTTPQEVTVSEEQAIDIGRVNGLKDPLSAAPVLVGGKICWRVVGQHTPTEQDYDNQTVYGFDVHCTAGEVIGEHRYIQSTPASPPPIRTGQITSLIEKLGFEDVENGAMIQVNVMNRADETFSVVKTFGRTVVKEGTIENADITLWIDRDIILNALESEDVVSYLQNNATSRNVIVELHKSMVLLQKKGYMSLYERVKKGA
ncbi:hypothetical protein C5S32_10925 [ANME-1 cluster archaeon GoMg1]|nr:hypothetical protein [ANME-1 cluster archaeon GoMg1]